MNNKRILFGMIIVLAVILLTAAAISRPGPSVQYKTSNESVCTENGKPVVSMYGTTTCPHCEWVKETFDRVTKEYADRGLIVAHHWQFDLKDDLLTPNAEGAIPQAELDKYERFNPKHTVPTFILGCKYSKVGNSFESSNDTAAEEAYLREYINKIV
ncbi:thioredoxin family protein [Candidatus Micrarchaeota archaeon]|nr:thioredoxin family protein [Candidatus Micrarchaeota archaeon]